MKASKITQRLEKAELSIETKNEFSGINFNENILEIAYQRDWDIHKIARCLKKANQERAKLLPIGLLEIPDFEETAHLAKDETQFIEQYRKKVLDTTVFEMNEPSKSKELVRHFDELLKQLT